MCALSKEVLNSSTPCLDIPEGECEYDESERSMSCAGPFDMSERDELVKTLTMCAYPSNDFDVTDILKYFPYLEHFTLMASNVTYVRGRFLPNNSLKVRIGGGFLLLRFARDIDEWVLRTINIVRYKSTGRGCKN